MKECWHGGVEDGAKAKDSWRIRLIETVTRVAANCKLGKDPIASFQDHTETCCSEG